MVTRTPLVAAVFGAAVILLGYRATRFFSSQHSQMSGQAADSHSSAMGRELAYLQPEHTGDQQSPINILTSKASHQTCKAALHYRSSQEHVRNLGHTIEVDWDEGSTIEYLEQRYELKQFHFHTPAEHLLDGVTYPMEIHLVHTLAGQPDKLLVVAALFKEGKTNSIIEGILPFVPEKPGGKLDAPQELDVSAFFEEDDGYYHYAGSLTTPPYSEVVQWLVLDGVHEASPAQIEKIEAIEGYNARHIQDARARPVEHCALQKEDPGVASGQP